MQQIRISCDSQAPNLTALPHVLPAVHQPEVCDLDPHTAELRLMAKAPAFAHKKEQTRVRIVEDPEGEAGFCLSAVRCLFHELKCTTSQEPDPLSSVAVGRGLVLVGMIKLGIEGAYTSFAYG